VFFTARNLPYNCEKERKRKRQRRLPVTDCVFGLGDGMARGAFDENGTGKGIRHPLHKGKLILSQHLLVHLRSLPQHLNKAKRKKKRKEKEFKSTWGLRSSTELQAWPPQANVSRSMLRRLARRSAKMPSLANMSRAGGSIPFWLKITNEAPCKNKKKTKRKQKEKKTKRKENQKPHLALFVVGADRAFEINDFADSVIDKLSFSQRHTIPLLCCRVNRL
jgi:hypothetical protein